MLVLSINFFIVAIVFSDVTRAFRYNKVDAFKAVSNKLSPLSLFNWGKNANTVSTESAPVAKNTDAAKLNKLKSNLEKISYTQKRDYNAEALKKEPPKPVIRDLQPKSYNYRKPQEFPNLYSGWLQKDGDQIAKQMIAAAKSAITSDKYIEILFDPVPNLDEVAFGTVSSFHVPIKTLPVCFYQHGSF